MVSEEKSTAVGVTLIDLIANDDRGGVTIDWVSLSAGILILGIIVVYTVMGNSAGYLMDEFDDLNKQFEASTADVTASAQLSAARQ